MDGVRVPFLLQAMVISHGFSCQLILFALAAAKRERDVPLCSTDLGLSSRTQRDFWNSVQIIQLYNDHFQSLNPDSEVARVLQSGWSG